MSEIIHQWKVGDWVVFDRGVVQVKEIFDTGGISVSDGFCSTSGNLWPRLRPLTLRNKAIVETFAIYYKRLYEIDGQSGFNYPRISTYFADLALRAIDNPDDETPFRLSEQFLQDARHYKPVIDGVSLFRPSRGI